jgi:hypothetical protein
MLKQQMLTAVKPIYYQDLENDIFSYADTTIPELLSHLTTTYGQLTSADLKNNRANLTEQWNPDEHLENLWRHIHVICSVATAGGSDITDGSTIELTLEALQKAGVYNRAITTWYDNDETNHTLPKFMLHFTKHEKECHHKLTARSAGFRGANNVTPEPATPPATTIPGNAYRGNEGTPAFNSNKIELYYCWIHGLSRNPQHTSSQCQSKSDNHQDTATLDNRMGGH